MSGKQKSFLVCTACANAKRIPTKDLINNVAMGICTACGKDAFVGYNPNKKGEPECH